MRAGRGTGKTSNRKIITGATMDGQFFLESGRAGHSCSLDTTKIFHSHRLINYPSKVSGIMTVFLQWLLVLVLPYFGLAHDSLYEHGYSDEGHSVLVHIRVELIVRHELNECSPQVQVQAIDTSSPPILPTLRNQAQDENNIQYVKCRYDFLLMEESNYSLIVHCPEHVPAGFREGHPPAFANITLSDDKGIFLTEQSLSLASRLHTISFKTESPTVYRSGLRGLQEEKKVYTDPPVRSDPQQKDRPVVVPPPTRPPPPPSPVSTPTQPAPMPFSQPVQSPTALQTPVVAPSQGGTLPPQSTGNGFTPAPTTSTAVKPPSFYSGSNTSAPSLSFEPSISPTVELPCTSTTNGSLPLDDKYMAVKLRFTNIQAGDVTQDETDTILADIVYAYNAVVNCDQKGALRRIDQAFLVRVNKDPSAASDIDWIVRLAGKCDGCVDSAQSLFTADSENSTDAMDTTDLPVAWLNSANGTVMEQTPCFCPGPKASTFQDSFTQRQVNSTEQINILSVVELENEESCDPTKLQEDLVPDHYSTLVTFVVTKDPSDMTEAALQLIYDRFIKNVHSHLTLTYPTCDLSRKQILDIQSDQNIPDIGRHLRSPHQDKGRRKVQQTSADFELVVNVTFTCLGCQGRLFGNTSFTPNLDCLCPKDGDSFGVSERDIISPLNDDIAELSIAQSISDIIEIEQVPCSSIINVFSTVVVIEYILKSNETTPSTDDLAVLEDQFVAGYNGMARRYCDPFFRRITSAETFPTYEVSEDGWRLNVEMSIIGTCRGNCTNDIPIYDPDAFFASVGMAVSGSNVSGSTTSVNVSRQRYLQMEGDSTCYCSVAANTVLGPSEPAIVQNFGELVDQLSLESVQEVAECRPLTFQKGIFLTIPATLANATQGELDRIGQAFIDSYNQQTQQEGFCDGYFRRLVDFRVDGNPDVKRSFTAKALGDGQSPVGRMLLTRTSFQPKRRTQAGQSDAPTFAPSSAPTLIPLIPINNTSIFLYVSGTCQGCPTNGGLFDQVSARRSLQGNNVNTTDAMREGSCFCPPQSARVQLSDETVSQALSSLVNGTVGLNEVELVDCSVEVNTFETTTLLDFLVNGDIAQDDEDYISNSFMTTYIRLSDEYCDSLFRVPNEIVSTSYEVASGPDQNGVSTVRFWLDFRGTCRGCTGSESLFDNKKRRRMQEGEVCYCEKNTIPRAPSDEEFQEAFATYLGSRRRLQQQGKFILLCVGSTCPVEAVVPSMSPSTVQLVNPGGVQNYPGCTVPNPAFIGDGYCDTSVDGNGQPIYNNAQCGNDGGDCCAGTCQSFTYVCGVDGEFACNAGGQDIPSLAPTIPLTCADQAGMLLGNGVCNLELNLPFCNYDEGDCCESTCGVSSGVTCVGPFPTCVDPNALENAPSASPTNVPSVTPSLAPSSTPSKVPSPSPSNQPSSAPSQAPVNPLTQECLDACGSIFCGDGFCDLDLNNPTCGWDGGDCCKGSCIDRKYDCPTLEADFNCRDPTYTLLPDSCSVNYPEWVGDGHCDFSAKYNTRACNWDGGDCCKETCQAREGDNRAPCTFFNCVERLPEGCLVPEASWVGDGFCDYQEPYNTAACLWDNGDCCPDTCVDSTNYICGVSSDYFCRNNNSAYFTNLTLPPSPPPGCDVDFPSWLGDGWCDGGDYNTEACGWDLGDCCAQSCQEAKWFKLYPCGAKEYDCQNPTVTPSVPKFCNVSNAESLGDGYCDGPSYNTALCQWDLGDCCPSTCLNQQWFKSKECGSNGYDCLDPTVSQRPALPTDCVVTDPTLLGDGNCDGGDYNSLRCDWDFGDCCEETCGIGGWYQPKSCGDNGYNCSDPDVPKRPDVPGDCPAQYQGYLGDGYCDDESPYNTAACLWDFGDCCEASCVEATWSKTYFCGIAGYACKNPSATQRPDIPTNCIVDSQSLLGDGNCNGGNYNTAACNWDFGDCCELTCGKVGWFQPITCGSSNYTCLDPSVPQPPSVPTDCIVDVDSKLGDGNCDGGNYNTDLCKWDFGDCCVETCGIGDWYQPFECGNGGYNCLDPKVTQDRPIPDGCVVNRTEYLGDGWCDRDVGNDYNNEECGWDLGDCCEPSCLSATWFQPNPCGINDYACLDPAYSVQRPQVPSLCAVEHESWLGDGKCDGGAYNSFNCDWDFGDCCIETCGNGGWYQPIPCGSSGYSCSVDTRPPVPDPCKVDYEDFLGDGWCDPYPYNSADCDWDFGDCCQGSCESAGWYQLYTCGDGDYACLDPVWSLRPSIPDGCQVDFEEFLGDGWCDPEPYNSLECGWDFGDCCKVSCETDTWYKPKECGVAGYSCSDPNDPQPRPQTPSLCAVQNEDWLGNGRCDDGAYNTEVCAWDFGDCCQATCGDGGWYQPYQCGSNGFSCLNPLAFLGSLSPELSSEFPSAFPSTFPSMVPSNIPPSEFPSVSPSDSPSSKAFLVPSQGPSQFPT